MKLQTISKKVTLCAFRYSECKGFKQAQFLVRKMCEHYRPLTGECKLAISEQGNEQAQKESNIK